MIYIVRHGTTEYNLEGRLQGQIDIPLNEEGMNDALQVAKELKHIHLDEIYSSDLVRAHATAKIIAHEHDTGGIIHDRRLREINLGRWQGHTYSDLRANEPDYEVFYSNPKSYTGTVPERYNFVIKRIDDFFHELNPNKDVLVVTHGFVIYWYLKEISYDKLVEPIKNCEIIKLDFKTKKFIRNFQNT